MVDGTDLRQFDPSSLRRSIGAVMQESVLLTFVKSMDFINEQNGTTPGIAILPGSLNRFPNIFNTGCDRRYTLNIGVCIPANQFCQRRFPGTRRPPQNHRMQLPCFNGPRQRFARR